MNSLEKPCRVLTVPGSSYSPFSDPLLHSTSPGCSQASSVGDAYMGSMPQAWEVHTQALCRKVHGLLTGYPPHDPYLPLSSPASLSQPDLPS